MFNEVNNQSIFGRGRPYNQSIFQDDNFLDRIDDTLSNRIGKVVRGILTGAVTGVALGLLLSGVLAVVSMPSLIIVYICGAILDVSVSFTAGVVSMLKVSAYLAFIGFFIGSICGAIYPDRAYLSYQELLLATYP